MRSRLRFAVLATLLAVVVIAPRAYGAPMWTDFATIRASAPIIVIGTVSQAVGPNNTALITVNVEQVVRSPTPGTPARGPMSVKDSPDGHVSVGSERVIAFIDTTGALRWVGTLVTGASLETGVIELKGFFDFNAHLVRPGLLTFAQLKNLLATGQLDQTFDATLAFRDGHGSVARSARTLTVQYAPITRVLTVIGATPVCLAASALFGLEWGHFQLHFTDACPSSTPNAAYRGLTFEGAFTGVDAATGHIQVELVPDRPFLTESEYATFATDPAIADMTSNVAITLSDGTTWNWRVEKDLVDPSGKAHASGGVSMSSQSQNGKTVSLNEYGFDGGVKLVLSPGASVGSPGGNPRGIVTLIDSGASTSCTFEQQGHVDRTCTLSVRPSTVIRR